ncbi:MAG: hypothetical protein U9O65_01640 [Thermotogota bacterium]|nr:hypothetical protein [Thermotogota bacterium]
MKLNINQEKFLSDNSDALKGIFNIWIQGMVERLINEEDEKKKALLQLAIREFRDFHKIVNFMKKDIKNNKESSI